MTSSLNISVTRGDMTKRKTPFFFTFKGLLNKPIFEYLNFSFHRHFNLLTSYNVKKRKKKNRAYAQSADKLKYKIAHKVELFHKKLAITTAHLSGQIFAPYSPFLSGKIHKLILSIMANWKPLE